MSNAELFEEAFHADLPRPLPATFRDGSYERRLRTCVQTIAAVGVLCLISAPLPFVKALEPNLLPLAWLKWIGWSLLGLAILQPTFSRIWRRPYRYVREGIPVKGRVQSIERIPYGLSSANCFRFAVKVIYQNPDNGQWQNTVIKSMDAWSLYWVNSISLEFQPGDEVTLVGIPGKYASTAQIYGFLGLDPDCELIRYKGRPLQGTSPWFATLITLACFFLFWLLLAFLEAIFFGMPFDETDNGGDWPVALATLLPGSLLGIGTVYWLRHQFLNNNRQKQNRIRDYACGLILGALLVFYGFITLNSRLDNSPGIFHPATSLSYRHWTHSGIIRTYEVEFELPDHPGRRNMKIRYPQLMSLGESSYAGLEVAPGRFGVPWMRGIFPATWVAAEEAAATEGPIYRAGVEFQTEQSAADITGEPEVRYYNLKPVFFLGDHQYAPVSPELVDPLIEELRKEHPEIQQLQQIHAAL